MSTKAPASKDVNACAKHVMTSCDFIIHFSKQVKNTAVSVLHCQVWNKLGVVARTDESLLKKVFDANKIAVIFEAQL
jgi:hypothetical protein